MQLDLMRVFEGYVRNYHTFNLSVHHGKHSFTMTEIEYFSRLGSMLGYYPFTEDTCNGKRRAMDLTWWGSYSYEEDYWHDFVLHLERENYFKKDEETLDKLFADEEPTPRHAIGILNVRNGARADELLKRAKSMCRLDEALLVFRTYSSGKKQPYFDEVLAYRLRKSKVVDERRASVTSIEGTLFMKLAD
ncbi:hypothetical protein [Paenibacillus sp.]|uniref:hypothetical protein n=1 Tax=Paenibacillus sp. TaxID=58172 RepID=UPI0028117308|nr:hypothetical protein [Paenibacillus sp.]